MEKKVSKNFPNGGRLGGRGGGGKNEGIDKNGEGRESGFASPGKFLLYPLPPPPQKKNK